MQFFVILRLLSTCRMLSATLMVTSFADIRLVSLLASSVRRLFCFWARGPELRLWGFGHWVPQLIFFSGLDIPLGAVDWGTPLEVTPSSSTPGFSPHGIFQAKVLEWGAIAFPASSPSVLYISYSLRGHTVLIHFMTFFCLNSMVEPNFFPLSLFSSSLCHWSENVLFKRTSAKYLETKVNETPSVLKSSIVWWGRQKGHGRLSSVLELKYVSNCAGV